MGAIDYELQCFQVRSRTSTFFAGKLDSWVHGSCLQYVRRSSACDVWRRVKKCERMN